MILLKMLLQILIIHGYMEQNKGGLPSNIVRDTTSDNPTVWRNTKFDEDRVKLNEHMSKVSEKFWFKKI